jgi:fumarate hydratase subunit beta
VIPIVLNRDKEKLLSLEAGTSLALSGVAYTARDAAHARLASMIRDGKALPFPLEDALIFYAGPAPAPPGRACGAIGPTTSSRMDPFTPLLLEKGIMGALGKGKRSPAVKEAFCRFGAVYLVAVGGVAALLSRYVEKIELCAFGDLGPEAVYRVELNGFPCFVGLDTRGGDIYTMREDRR